MAIAWTDVVAVAPDLASVPNATQTYLLDAVNNRWVDDDACGEFADDMRRMLAAHVASLRNDDGLVTDETIGPMSRSYMVPPGLQGSLALSTFGAEYARLLQLTPGGLGMVV